MKKLLGVLFIVLVFAFNAFAVESITWATYGDPIKGLEVKATIVSASNGSVTTTVLQDVAGNTLSLQNYYLYGISTYFGATAPTDNTDLELLEHTNAGYDVLHGAGANTIDAAANNSFKPWINSKEAAMPVYGPLFQKISNNSVDSATFVIVYRFLSRN